MKNEKGFTLIELLAIIVILAIIAVITVPIILNIIENAKRGSIVDSAYGYKDSIQKYYMSKSVSNTGVELPTETYNIADLPSDFDVSGEHPVDGWVQLEKGAVIAYSLKFGDYVVTMNENGELTVGKGGELAVPLSNKVDITRMTTGLLVDDVQYYTGGVGETPDNIVYFDPINGTVNCTTYHEDNSITGFNGVITGENSTKTTDNQTSCLKWFLYSVENKDTADNAVNMILDHNINLSGSGVQWVSSSNYYNGSTLMSTLFVTNIGNGSYGLNGNNDKGPLTALDYLKTRTSNWITSVSGEYSTYTAGTSNSTYSVNYSQYRARLIVAKEVAYIKGQTFNETIATALVSGLPNWLYVNTNTTQNGLCGYWTSSPNTDSSRAWSVDGLGRLNNYVVKDYSSGIRPVVSILKSRIL